MLKSTKFVSTVIIISHHCLLQIVATHSFGAQQNVEGMDISNGQPNVVMQSVVFGKKGNVLPTDVCEGDDKIDNCNIESAIRKLLKLIYPCANHSLDQEDCDCAEDCNDVFGDVRMERLVKLFNNKKEKKLKNYVRNIPQRNVEHSSQKANGNQDEEESEEVNLNGRRSKDIINRAPQRRRDITIETNRLQDGGVSEEVHLGRRRNKQVIDTVPQRDMVIGTNRLQGGGDSEEVHISRRRNKQVIDTVPQRDMVIGTNRLQGGGDSEEVHISRRRNKHVRGIIPHRSRDNEMGYTRLQDRKYLDVMEEGNESSENLKSKSHQLRKSYGRENDWWDAGDCGCEEEAWQQRGMLMNKPDHYGFRRRRKPYVPNFERQRLGGDWVRSQNQDLPFNSKTGTSSVPQDILYIPQIDKPSRRRIKPLPPPEPEWSTSEYY